MKYILVAGACPNFMKVAPIMQAPPRKNTLPEKWDGNAAERIVEVVLNEHSVSS
jgi:hypothetical protein